jgi:hypothetical protein
MKFKAAGIARTLAFTCLALVWSGCAGYRLGSSLPPGIKSVHIPTFQNKCGEPLIEIDATRAAISAIQRDGSLQIKSIDTADAVLEVTLTSFDMDPLAYREDKRTAARQYRMILLASYVMKTPSGAVIAQNSRVRGEATVDVSGDLSSSKARGLPALTDDLAHQIIKRITETWQ